MYLRDIVITAQKIRDEAWMSDDQKRMATLDHALSWPYVHCVTDLFVLVVERKSLRTKDIGKVIVNLNDRITIPSIHTIRMGPPLLSFEWPLPSAGTSARSTYEEKKAILDVLCNSLKWLTSVQGWDVAVIEEAYSEIMDAGICHRGYWKNGKSIVSPDRATKAKIYYECELDRLRIYCVFYRGKHEEIGRKIVIDEPAMDAPLMCYWKDIKWTSNSSLLLRTKDGRSVKCSMKNLGSVGDMRDGK
jgi:hypothetical protein